MKKKKFGELSESEIMKEKIEDLLAKYNEKIECNIAYDMLQEENIVYKNVINDLKELI